MEVESEGKKKKKKSEEKRGNKKIQKPSPRSLMSSDTLKALEAALASSPDTNLLALSVSSSARTPTSVVKWPMLSASSCALSEAT